MVRNDFGLDLDVRLYWLLSFLIFTTL
jgi:hypothetical protein